MPEAAAWANEMIDDESHVMNSINQHVGNRAEVRAILFINYK
jgi:hypothetical protein